MDKNTITGLVLIAILLVGFSFLSRPSQEQLEALYSFAKYGEDVSEPLDITVENGLGGDYTTAINILKENAAWNQPMADVTGLMLNWYFYHYNWIKDNRNIELESL